MTCLWCGKHLLGGFGIGPEPHMAHSCADCVIAGVEKESRTFALEKLADAVKAAWSLYGDGYYVRKQHRDEVSRWLRILERKQ